MDDEVCSRGRWVDRACRCEVVREKTMKIGMVSAVLCLAMVSGSAMGQITAPPTKAPEPTPEFVMPPPPAPAAAPGPGPKPPAGNGGQVQQLPTMAIEPPLRGTDGKLVKLTEPLFWQAMKHNVSLTPTVFEKATPFLAKRLRKYEKIVTDNVDLMRQVTEGVIDKAQLLPQRGADGRKGIQGADGKMGLSGLMQVLKPLVGDNVREEMQKRGIMTRIQAGQNTKVMQSFAQETSADFEKTLPVLPKIVEDPDPAKQVINAKAVQDLQKERKEVLDRERMRQQMTLWIDEALFAYEGLLNEGGEKIDEVLSKAAVDSKATADAVKVVKAATDRAGRVIAMRALVATLPVDQERAILQAVRDMRPPVVEEPEAEPAAAEPAAEATGGTDATPK